MTTPYPHAAKFGPEDLRRWNPATQQLTAPVAVYVYAVGTSTRSTLYTDNTRATPLTNNPVPTGVAANSPGLDATGNLIFFAEHNNYDVVADGVRLTVRTIPEPADMQAGSGGGGGFNPATYVNF